MEPTSDRPARRRSALGPLVLALPLAVLALGACGQPSSTEPADGVAATVSVPVQPTIRPDTGTPQHVDPSAPISGEPFDSTQALVSSNCTAKGDVWSFTGRVENTDTDPHTFTVGVFVNDTKDGSQMGGKEIVVTVAPGGSAPVAAKAFYAGRTKGLECLTGVTVKGES